MFCNLKPVRTIIIRKPIKEHRTEPYQYPTNPIYVIVDISWIDYFYPEYYWFFEKYPPRAILETVTSIPTLEDYDPAVWSMIETLFNDHELQNFDFSSVSIIIEQLVILFYDRLNEIAPNIETRYIFKEWIDKDTIAMIREDAIK